MPRKMLLSNRQLHAIQKIGLAPLTSVNDFAKRFGIPQGRLQTMTIGRKKSLSLEHKRTLTRRFRSQDKRHLLEHPKLWALGRIENLAPTHTNKEITRILASEARQRNTQKPQQQYTAPTEDTIRNYVHRFELRTPDEHYQALSRAHRKRSPNLLSSQARRRLVEIGNIYLAERITRPPKGMDLDELLQELNKRLVDEAIYFDPKRTNLPLETAWIHFIEKTRKNFVVDVLRRHGPVTRGGNQRRPRPAPNYSKSMRVLRKPAALPEIRFREPLTTQERKVFDLLLDGFLQKEIAKKLGLGPSRISKIVRSLRENIRVE
ncbi:MAG: response regulator transcription factor [Candidatus Diapherotrites archaeon]|uniref:Response regulator transcription factor n=1 Tax=Candidatus Iainarchaeum sp. TaxID=3101447 RepID=A0A8T4L6Q5_9ARCH|nr:response regulator transcription factor [Candidatus Diapherotrites archaeon]